MENNVCSKNVRNPLTFRSASPSGDDFLKTQKIEENAVSSATASSTSMNYSQNLEKNWIISSKRKNLLRKLSPGKRRRSKISTEILLKSTILQVFSSDLIPLAERKLKEKIEVGNFQDKYSSPG